MKLSRNAVALTSAIWALSAACADTSHDELDSTTDADALAQRIPVGVTPTTPTPTTPTTPRRPAPPTPTPTTPTGGSASDTITVPDPNGTYFANVQAAGNGCRPGTWDVDISPDGKAFTLLFDEYLVNLTDNETRTRKTIDCTVNITLNSPSGLSVAVTSLTYQGYVFAERGVTAAATAYYSFTGQRIDSVSGPGVRNTRHEFKGPFDSSFMFEDVIKTQDLVYSECGRQRTLNVNTSLSVNKSSATSTGYINMSSIDGETESKIILKLNLRPCRA